MSAISLDGSRGEGGGQVLRTSLAVAALQQRPLEIRQIRAGRAKPGLARQHLTCVQAAAEIAGATLEGATLRSTRLRFTPTRPATAGDYHFDIGTAGSTGLVFQTVLWPLLAATGTSNVVIEGGTHNSMAPSFDFLERCFLPVLRRFGADVELEIERRGFYPRGGGRIRARITGPTSYQPIALLERGEHRSTTAQVICQGLPLDVAEREAEELARVLGIGRDAIFIDAKESQSRGNALHIELSFERITELVCGFGERRVPGERVARETATEAHTYLSTSAPVGEHLADQLIIPMALAGGGELRCTTPSLHTRTNADLVRELLGIEIAIEREHEQDGSYRMRAYAIG